MHVNVIKSQALKQPFMLYDLSRERASVSSIVMISHESARVRSETKIGYP